jgi:hypothetical protein
LKSFDTNIITAAAAAAKARLLDTWDDFAQMGRVIRRRRKYCCMPLTATGVNVGIHRLNFVLLIK